MSESRIFEVVEFLQTSELTSRDHLAKHHLFKVRAHQFVASREHLPFRNAVHIVEAEEAVAVVIAISHEQRIARSHRAEEERRTFVVAFEVLIANLVQTEFHRHTIHHPIFVDHEERTLLLAVVHSKREPTLVPVLFVHHAPFALVVESEISHRVDAIILIPVVHHIRADERSACLFQQSESIELLCCLVRILRCRGGRRSR